MENTITLINVVFLMLIFFLIAGSLTPPLDKDISLISTEVSDSSEPPDALFVTRDGLMRARGQQTDAASYVASLNDKLGDGGQGVIVKLAADRELPATRLIEIVGDLRAAGATRVAVVTERSGS